MPESQDLPARLAALYQEASRLRQQIADFQPDLIAATLESGWYLILAARALSADTERPFPPTVRLNLGIDKVRLFEAIDTPLKAKYPFITSNSGRRYEFLTWLADQMEWQAYLRQRIANVLGSECAPVRILIVDGNPADMDHSQDEQISNTLVAIGLFDVVFPQARVQTFTGKTHCQVALAAAWLERFYPKALPMIHQEWSQQLAAASWQHRPRGFFSIVSGVEGGPAESLAWQPLGYNSSLIKSWMKYLPAEAWLELPEWAANTITSEMARLKDASAVPHPAQAIENIDRNLSLTERVIRDVYHDGQITLAQVCSRYQVNRREARKVLEYCTEINELFEQGQGRNTVYIVSPEKHFTPPPAAPGIVLRDDVEILPERLWVGWLDSKVDAEDEFHIVHHQIVPLRDQGFTYLVKATTEIEPAEIYEIEMPELLATYGQTMKFREYDLGGRFTWLMQAKRWRPRMETVFQIVLGLEELLHAGHKVFFGQNDFGDLIIHCLMARRLGSEPQAFKNLRQCRARSVYYWRPGVDTSHNRPYVRRWLKRYGTGQPGAGEA